MHYITALQESQHTQIVLFNPDLQDKVHMQLLKWRAMYIQLSMVRTAMLAPAASSIMMHQIVEQMKGRQSRALQVLATPLSSQCRA